MIGLGISCGLREHRQTYVCLETGVARDVRSSFIWGLPICERSSPMRVTGVSAIREVRATAVAHRWVSVQSQEFDWRGRFLSAPRVSYWGLWNAAMLCIDAESVERIRTAVPDIDNRIAADVLQTVDDVRSLEASNLLAMMARTDSALGLLWLRVQWDRLRAAPSHAAGQVESPGSGNADPRSEALRNNP